VGLIGLPANGLAFAPLDFTAPTFTDLLNSTLDGTGTFGADIDLSSSALSDLMTAFENDVTSTDAADTIPDVTPDILSTVVLDAIALELAVASSTELAISDALSFLGATFGVWAVFNVLLTDIELLIQNFINNILGLLGSLFGPGFGGGQSSSNFGQFGP
jgi:hypothetical protein